MKGIRILVAIVCMAAAACGGPSSSAVVGDSGMETGTASSSGNPSSSGSSGASSSSSSGASSSSSSGGGTQGSASKVDILFSIDNSASMGDKQDYLKRAIPDLISRLVNPNCVDATGAFVAPSTNGSCASGKLEFAPVRDMHLGIVSSSLGSRLGNACTPTAMAPTPFNNILAHNDDESHLLNRSLTYVAGGASVTEGVVGAAAPTPQDQFLYWYPQTSAAPGPGTPETSSSQLIADFTSLVGGVGVFGCGIESQLESWYRFLIQPDPYESLSLTNGTFPAVWQGVDQVILQQRHDFLRPDSIVAVVVLSDENDSEIDVRSLSGQSYLFMSTSFDPPRATSACGTGLPTDAPGAPNSPGCMSCSQAGASTDPNCTKGAYTAFNDWGFDLNLRHVHMKAKYGVDPQYPIERYVTGLTSPTVPDRSGEYPAGATSYQGTNDCVNPLFAASLPDGSKVDTGSLCNLPPGTRTSDLVFYMHIGGVPYELLHYTPGNAAASTLSASDWIKILGNDPQHYDYSGIDPHMIESYQPRPGLAVPGSANTADPISGHEWVTDSGQGHVLQVDRQYACIFPLADASGAPAPRDCSKPENSNFCDCPKASGTLTAQQLPPVCDTTTQSTQTAAKAYPTIRELLLAKLLGTQATVASICPQHVVEQMPGDPLFGYRPAISLLVSRLATAIGHP